MDDNEYLRKAVELAEGWFYLRNDLHMPLSGWSEGFLLPEMGQLELDALAAQLVRQHLRRCTASVYTAWHRDTMKTIKWLVDNG